MRVDAPRLPTTTPTQPRHDSCAVLTPTLHLCVCEQLQFGAQMDGARIDGQPPAVVLYTSDKLNTSQVKGQLMDIQQRHAQAAYFAVHFAKFQHDSHQLFQEEKAFWRRTSDELGGIHRRHIELLRQQQLVQHEHQQLLQQLLKMENRLCEEILMLANNVVMKVAMS